jgi:hypothetical protein
VIFGTKNFSYRAAIVIAESGAEKRSGASVAIVNDLKPTDISTTFVPADPL